MIEFIASLTAAIVAAALSLAVLYVMAYAAASGVCAATPAC